MGIANITNNILTDSGVLTSSLVSGTGTTNYLPKWTSGSALGNSLIYDDGNVISIGTNATLVQTLNINSTFATQSLNSTSGNFAYIALLNGATSGGFFIGAEGSTGGTFGTGSTAYAGVLSRLGAYNLQFATNNVVGMTLFSTGNLALNSTTDNGNRLQVTGNGYFSGDLGIGIVSPLSVTNYRSLDIRGTTGSLIEMGNTSNQITGRFIEIEATSSIAKFMAFNSVPLVLGTQGQERMRIDTSGNIGLGVVPSAWLSSLKVIQIGSTLALTDGSNQSTFWHNTYVDTLGNPKYLTTAAASFYRMIGAQHIWFNAPSGTAGNTISFTQAMALTASGNLLVGTTTDDGTKIQIYSSASAIISYRRTSISNQFYFGADTSGTYWGNATAGTTPIYLTNGGNLLVGTIVDSGEKLQISGRAKVSNNSNNVLLVKQNATSLSNDVYALDVDSSAHTSNMSVSGAFIVRVNSGTGLVVNGNGNVGIGTASPTRSLDVNNELSVRNSNDQLLVSPTGAGLLRIYARDFSTFGDISLGFFTGVTERMRITSGGNLLVGTTTDSGERLQISGTMKVSGASTFVGAINLNSLIDFKSSGFTYYQLFLQSPSSNFKIYNSNYGRTDLEFTQTTGAATFSSSVTATNFYSTGASNFATSSGNVGIGTSSPAGKLTIADSVNNGTANVLYLSNTSQTGVTSAAINFINIDGTIKSSIIGAVYGNDYMTFNVGSNTERMRLTSGGSVGIGTTSPLANLHVSATSGLTEIRNTQGASSFKIVTGTGFSTVGTLSNDPLVIVTNDTERMRFATSGNLLVGTTVDSGDRLQVSGNGYISGNLGLGISASSWASFTGLNIGFRGSISSNVGETHISHNAYYDGAWKFISTGIASDYYSVNGSHIWRRSTGGGIPNSTITFTQAMTLTSGGNLLVGTTVDGGYKLQVTSASADSHLNVWGATSPSIRLANASSAATQGFAIGLATGTNNFMQGSVAGDVCLTTATASPILFGMWQTSSASEVMRITTSSNLLIGTSTDSGEKLQVSGNTKITVSTNGTHDVTNGTILLRSQIGAEGRFGTQSNHDLALTTNNTTRLTVTSGGSVNIGSVAGVEPYLSNKLNVGGSAYFNGKIYLDGVGTSGEPHLKISSGTTDGAQIRLLTSTAPTSPSNGDIWFDGSDLKIRIAGVTKTFTIV